MAFVVRLPLTFLPDNAPPALEITYSIPNTPPEQLEQKVSSTLENALSQISGIQKIKSTSSFNNGRINLTFHKGVNIDFKKYEVSTVIRQLYPSLPSDLEYPSINQQLEDDEYQSPILSYDIIAPDSPSQIQELIEQSLRLSLLQLSGVKEIVFSGTTPQQITIIFQQQLMQSYGIIPEDIIKHIQTQFEEYHVGSHKNANGQVFYLKTTNPLDDIRQLENLVLSYSHAGKVRLKDIAQVFVEKQKPQNYYRINGDNTVSLSIYAHKGVNRISLANHLKKAIAQESTSLPYSYKVLLDYDDSKFLEEELQKIYKRSGLSMLVLLTLIFILKRSWRYVLALFSGILTNLSITALLMYWLDINIHLYTLAGLTISFGLIIDNSIVMLDHLHHNNNRKAFLAILAASLTSIAALSIVCFLPEQEQNSLLDFTIVISLNLMVSLLVALFYTPAINELLLIHRPKNKKLSMKGVRLRVKIFESYCAIIFYLVRNRKLLMLTIILFFGLPVFVLPAKWEDKEWYNTTFVSELYQDDIRPYVDQVLGGTLRLFVRNVFENSGYRTPEETKLFLTAELPNGSTLEQMNNIIQHLEQYLRRIEGIDRFISNISSGQHAHMMITFKQGYEESMLPYRLKSRLTSRGLAWDGVKWNIWGVGRGFNNDTDGKVSSFRVLLKGYNYNELEQLAQKLADKLLNHQRIQAVNTNEHLDWKEKLSNEWVLVMKHEPLLLRGSTKSQAVQVLKDRTVSNSLSNYYVKMQGTMFPVQIYHEDVKRYDKHSLLNQPVSISDSLQLDFNEFVKLKLQQTVNTIYKEDRQYFRIIGYDYNGSVHFGNKHLDEILEDIKAEAPIGYTAEKLTLGWDDDTIKRQYALLLFLSIAIYFICSVLFESLLQPLFIVAIIPVSYIGLFLTFAVFGFYFDQGGYASFLLLGGLVVNAAIFIINEINNLKSLNYNRAILKAVRAKFQSILLTIASTCLGLCPFLLEGDNEVFWFSLAAGTIGGLAFSVLAIFFFLPVGLWKKN